MSVSFYHLIHLLSLVAMVSSLSILLLAQERSKLANIVFGISSLTLLIAGFGMVSKLGYPMGAAWIIGKILVWAALALGVPWVAKRFYSRRKVVFVIVMGLIAVALFLALYKPM